MPLIFEPNLAFSDEEKLTLVEMQVGDLATHLADFEALENPLIDYAKVLQDNIDYIQHAYDNSVNPVTIFASPLRLRQIRDLKKD